MKVAYFDCASGVSGDMMLGALIDAGVSLTAIGQQLDSLKIPGCRLDAELVKRRGFRGTKVHIHHQPENAHRHLKDIQALLDGSQLTPRQRALSEQVFRRLAEAEAHVHNASVDKVHFHEVGAVDSIADIVGSCVAWDLLGVESAVASPIAVGGGFVEIAHGRCGVPAPATAELLRGAPILAGPIEAELTTPTGAALLMCFVKSFGSLPPMTVEATGYGAGSHDFPTHANLLRIIVGTSERGATESASIEQDEVLCLETNLDDCSGQAVAYCAQKLWEAGALDVFSIPILMKKGRPGILFSVLCAPLHRETMESILFRHTSTIGIRRWLVRRSKLARQAVTVQTAFGPLRGKKVTLPDGSGRVTLEYESVRSCADAQGISLDEVLREVR